MAEQAPGRSRAGFGPVVLAGLGSAGLAALASARPWYSAAVDSTTMPGVREPDAQADMPLALALSLVVLAAWGVVLVSRTRGRRVALVLGGIAALGVNACVWMAPSSLPDQVRERLGDDSVEVSMTGWFAVAAIAALAAVVVAAVGFRSAPGWPAMGAKYDAPTGAPVGEADLWKALDAGHDPTAADERRDP